MMILSSEFYRKELSWEYSLYLILIFFGENRPIILQLFLSGKFLEFKEYIMG